MIPEGFIKISSSLNEFWCSNWFWVNLGKCGRVRARHMSKYKSVHLFHISNDPWKFHQHLIITSRILVLYVIWGVFGQCRHARASQRASRMRKVCSVSSPYGYLTSCKISEKNIKPFRSQTKLKNPAIWLVETFCLLKLENRNFPRHVNGVC